MVLQVHLPSMTVYANFPNKSLELARPEVVAFSPNGGYFAVGNNIGAVRLFRYVTYYYYIFKL
jgi:U3 small nucleolar RNA-associated protein 18